MDPAPGAPRPRWTGLAEPEGAFLLCTFWLARARTLAGQLAQAREVFDRAVGYANDLGLLAEQVDPATGQLLGNFPQAFSHIRLVNAAYAIAEAEKRPGAHAHAHAHAKPHHRADSGEIPAVARQARDHDVETGPARPRTGRASPGTGGPA